MRPATRARLATAIGSALLALPVVLAAPAFVANPALASTDTEVARTWSHAAHRGRHLVLAHVRRPFRHGGGVQCVPFARAVSGIAIKGNAVNWWDAAAGVYARGQLPETGAVLNFRATAWMRLGHVAVVKNVLSPREIEIDHANWTHYGAVRGDISLATRVIDVSADNDWSAVRVELGHSGSFGAVYPTYGFIYDRPDNGTLIANTLAAPHPTIERPALDADEVAEAPVRNDMPAGRLPPLDAPDRSLR